MTARSAFVGRAPALDALTAALTEGGHLVLIEGEAGIGKSRLVQEALSRWPAAADVLVLNCPPLQDPFPLGPVVEALHGRGLAGVHLSPLGGALRPLFPEWADQLPPALEPLDDPRQTRHRLFRAIAEVIDRLGVRTVVVEDAHWADESTLELLIMMTSNPDPPSVVVTCRPTDIPDGSLLLNLTARVADLTPLRVPLQPLDETATRAVISSMFDTSEVSAQFVHFVHQHTGGIPLAMEETLSLLRDRGDIVRARGEWTRRAVEDLTVPPTVRDSVLERVQRLERVTRDLLAGAAILATPATERVLGRVAGLSAGDARRGVAQALDSGLFGEAKPGHFGFRHVLAARAVEDAVAISERRHLHLQAATVLLDLRPQPVARLARHFREANRPAEWATFAEAAAELALQAGDDRAAVDLLLDVVGVVQPPNRRADVARRLGEVATWGVAALGDLGTRVAETLTAVAGGDCPAEVRGELRLLLGRLLLQWGEFDRASVQIEAALPDLSGRPELAVRAMISLAWPRGRAVRPATHLGWLDRATELYPRHPPSPDHTWFDVDRASVLMMLGDPRGWPAAQALRRRPPESIGGRRQVARLLMNMGHVAIAWGCDEDARAVLSEAVAQLEATGYHRLVNSARLTAGHLDWHAGRWHGLADRVAGIAEEEDTLPEAVLEARLVEALLALVDGDRSRAERQLADLVAETERRALVDAQLSPAAAWAEIRLSADDAAGAHAILEPVVDTLVRKEMWAVSGNLSPTYVRVLIASDDLEGARRFTETVAAGMAGQALPAPTAALHTCRGLVLEAAGKVDEAAASFAAATSLWASMPRPYAALLGRERELRCVLADDEQHASALAGLREVERRLRQLGARWDADRVARVLRRHGIEVARTWHGGRRGYGDALSPRELEVVRLVARGLTNREVAASLFLSPRTIDRHLSAAMRKFDVSSRTSLALAAAEAGLLPSGSAGGPAKIG